MSLTINLVDGHIDLKCCCVAFKIECFKMIIEELTIYKTEHPLGNFKVMPKLKVAYKKELIDPIE